MDQWVHHEGLIQWPIAPWTDAVPWSDILLPRRDKEINKIELIIKFLTTPQLKIEMAIGWKLNGNVKANMYISKKKMCQVIKYSVKSFTI